MQMNLLTGIAVSIIFATLSALVAKRFKQPLILGYIVGGILLGHNMGFGIISDEGSIEMISEIGLILLLFIIGLEINVTKLAAAGKMVGIAGTVQFFGTILLGFGFFHYLGFSSGMTKFNIGYLALALSLSSTMIVVKILHDQHDIDSHAGRVTLGILIFQDIWAIIFLTIQPNLLNPEIIGIFNSFLSAMGLLFSCFLVSKHILPKLYAFIAKSPELMLITSISWCFLVSGTANAVGLSKEMGALVAGLSIAAFPYSIDVIAKITGIRDFFITLFFVSLGLKAPSLTPYLVIVALSLTAFVLASRLLTLLPALLALKLDLRTGLLTSINLSQVSEFSMVIVTLGFSYGHVSEEVVQIIILSLVLSSILSTYLILAKEHLVSWVVWQVKGLSGQNKEKSTLPIAKKEKKGIVLLGFFKEASPFLHRINEEMPSLKDSLFVIDFNPQTLALLKKYEVDCVYGDIAHPETLRHAGIEGANLVISTISDSFLQGTSNLRLLKQVKMLSPESRVIVTSDSLRGAQTLYDAGADYVLLPRLLYARHIFDIVQTYLVNGLDATRESQIQDIFKDPVSEYRPDTAVPKIS
ncbi:MAG: cation:proton antiporter [Nitrospira sp.]|nr:sodium:proton exchanger [Candidatus Manganitrophaceae bacterium]HIL35822.1 sodium:proton exchanger [Candidatus Manganitrophaceae bacterium]